MSGYAATIGENSASYRGGGVYIESGNFNMSDTTIIYSSNRAPGGGRLIYRHNGTVIINGKVFPPSSWKEKSGANSWDSGMGHGLDLRADEVEVE
jgi:hypothetical protein